MFYNDRHRFCFKPRTERVLVVTCSCEVISQVWKQSPVSDPPREGALFFLSAVLRKLCPRRLCASARGEGQEPAPELTLCRMAHATATHTMQCKEVIFTLRNGTLSGPIAYCWRPLFSSKFSVFQTHLWGTHWAWTVVLCALRAVRWHEWLKGKKFGSSNWLDHFG